MKTNEELIRHFYTSFKNKDVKAMQDCYADNAVFNDPAFTNLNANEVRAMWAMLLRSKDMRIEFKNVKGTENGATAEWDAWYTFSKTGNKVFNPVKASFIIENGKIVKHTDHFNFYNWAKQSLGFIGVLLGWTSFLQNKVSKTAKQGLKDYMAGKA